MVGPPNAVTAVCNSAELALPDGNARRTTYGERVILPVDDGTIVLLVFQDCAPPGNAKVLRVFFCFVSINDRVVLHHFEMNPLSM